MPISPISPRESATLKRKLLDIETKYAVKKPKAPKQRPVKLQAVYVPDFGPPRGFYCHICGKVLRRNDRALWGRRKYLDVVVPVSYHMSCMRELIDTEPVEVGVRNSRDYVKEFEELQDLVRKGEPLL